MRVRPKLPALLSWGLTATILALSAPAAAIEVGGEVSLIYDSNLNNAPADQEQEDGALHMSMHLGTTLQPHRRAHLLLRAGIATGVYREFTDLSLAEIEFLARYRYRLGAAQYAPSFLAQASLSAWEVNDALRDQTIFRGLIGLLQPLAPGWSLRAQIDARISEARERLYDTRAVGGLLELEWAVTDKWLLYLDQRWQSGDVVSTGNPTLAVINRADVVVADDAFGAGGFGWRLDGDSWISGLGSNWQLRPNLSVDLLFRHIDTENELGQHYRREQFFSSLLYRY